MGKGGEKAQSSTVELLEGKDSRKISLEELSEHRTPDNGQYRYLYPILREFIELISS